MTEAQAEADARNASLAQINPKRAQQIEWYAGKDGRLYLRDKPRADVRTGGAPQA